MDSKITFPPMHQLDADSHVHDGVLNLTPQGFQMLREVAGQLSGADPSPHAVNFKPKTDPDMVPAYTDIKNSRSIEQIASWVREDIQNEKGLSLKGGLLHAIKNSYELAHKWANKNVKPAVFVSKVSKLELKKQDKQKSKLSAEELAVIEAMTGKEKKIHQHIQTVRELHDSFGKRKKVSFASPTGSYTDDEISKHVWADLLQATYAKSKKKDMHGFKYKPKLSVAGAG